MRYLRAREYPSALPLTSTLQCARARCDKGPQLAEEGAERQYSEGKHLALGGRHSTNQRQWPGEKGALEDAPDNPDQTTTDQKGDGQKARQKSAPTLGRV